LFLTVTDDGTVVVLLCYCSGFPDEQDHAYMGCGDRPMYQRIWSERGRFFCIFFRFSDFLALTYLVLVFRTRFIKLMLVSSPCWQLAGFCGKNGVEIRGERHPFMCGAGF